MTLMFDSVRTRLTFWYVGVLALTLIVFSAGVYLLLDRDLGRRLDESLRASSESIAASLDRERAEGESVKEAAHSTVEELHLLNQAMAIFDDKGNLLEEKTTADHRHASFPPPEVVASTNLYIFTSHGPSGQDKDGQRVATRLVKINDTDPPYLIVVSQPMETITVELEMFGQVLLVAVPLALLLAGLGGFFLARKSLAPVVVMSERARQISAENLEQRLPVANPRDELGQLAATFNELLARLDTSFNLQRQFMADASHELRTPLSVMRTATQVTLEKPRRDESEYRDALAMINAQTQRLSRIVDDMFTLARADSGRRPLTLNSFYLEELTSETARAAGILATRKGVKVEAPPSPETLYYGDEELLRQMLLNLLDNAIRHTQPGGLVRISIAQFDSFCEVVVTDTGMGIPVEAQPHIFERFYRPDKARSHAHTGGNSNGVHNQSPNNLYANDQGANNQGGGAGLGLSIARWVAEAHGGTIKLVYSNSTGTAFAVVLPLKRP
jgi:heavy metal sensor kinase